MTKKEFKKKCKAERASSYKLTLSGSIIASFGLIAVLAALFFIKTGLVQIIMYEVGVYLLL